MMHQGAGCFVNRISQTYVALMLAPRADDGSRALPLARFGAFEVRVIELGDRRDSDASDLWLELYRHDTRTSLDSCRCSDLDEAESAADEFISRARALLESQGTSDVSS